MMFYRSRIPGKSSRLMMFYRSPPQDGLAWYEASDDSWGKLAGVIFAAHGGQHPDGPPAGEDPAP